MTNNTIEISKLAGYSVTNIAERKGRVRGEMCRRNCGFVPECFVIVPPSIKIAAGCLHS